jgi:hypothetical protein
MEDGSFYGKLVDGGDAECGPVPMAASEVPVSFGVREGNVVVVVKLAADGEMIPPVQPVVESGRQREADDEEIVANGNIQLKS